MIFNIFGHEIRIDERPEVIIETVETIKFVDKEQEYISFPHQESIVYASYSTVKDKVRSLDGFYKLGDIHIEDTSYKLVDVEHLKEWLKVDTTDILNYVPEYHDCDDFAVTLHGHLNEWDSSLATAIAKVKKDGSTSRHMMNLVIGTDMKVYLIEPQNDNIFVDANGYQIRDVFFL